MTTERYPLDVRTINKGDYISPETIEGIFGDLRESNSYRLKLMGLHSWLNKAMKEAGKPVTIKFEREGLRVLLDNEAVDYAGRRNRHHMRGIYRTHDKLHDVTIGNLTECEKNRFNNECIRQGRIVYAMRKTSRLLDGPLPVDTPQLEIDN